MRRNITRFVRSYVSIFIPDVEPASIESFSTADCDRNVDKPISVSSSRVVKTSLLTCIAPACS